MTLDKIGSERDRTFSLADGHLELSQVQVDDAQRPMCVRVSIVERDRPRRSLDRLFYRFRRFLAPLVDVRQPVGDGEERVGRGEIRVQIDGALQQLPALKVLLSCQPPHQFTTPQEAVIGFQILGLLGREPLLVPGCQLEFQSADDLLRDVILHREDIGQVAIETLRPLMPASGRINELRGDPHLVARFADASFQHVAHGRRCSRRTSNCAGRHCWLCLRCGADLERIDADRLGDVLELHVAEIVTARSSLALTWRYASSDRQMAPGAAIPSRREAMLTPSPIRSPSLSSTTSPRWMPIRNSMRRSC